MSITCLNQILEFIFIQFCNGFSGCDRGIGKALAKSLDLEGFTVYAGCLDNQGPGSKDLVNACSSRLHTVQLDVSDENQIKEAAVAIQKDMEVKGN